MTRRVSREGLEKSPAEVGLDQGRKSCAWLAQIEFTEWTPDGHLRHSKFVGLREDKRAREVVRERSRVSHDSEAFPGLCVGQ